MTAVVIVWSFISFWGIMFYVWRRHPEFDRQAKKNWFVGLAYLAALIAVSLGPMWVVMSL